MMIFHVLKGSLFENVCIQLEQKYKIICHMFVEATLCTTSTVQS